MPASEPDENVGRPAPRQALKSQAPPRSSLFAAVDTLYSTIVVHAPKEIGRAIEKYVNADHVAGKLLKLSVAAAIGTTWCLCVTALFPGHAIPVRERKILALPIS